MTGAPNPDRYAVSVRILHWIAAALVFTTLIVGFVLANTLAGYALLLSVHKMLGASVLVLIVVRVVNRLRHRTPSLPATVGRWERRAVVGSEGLFYVLLLAQPLVGWGMLSASGVPVVVGPFRLPSIAPVDADLFALLRNGHSVIGYSLVVLIAAHVSAVLLHTLTLRDGMLQRMGFGPRAISTSAGANEPFEAQRRT